MNPSLSPYQACHDTHSKAHLTRSDDAYITMFSSPLWIRNGRCGVHGPHHGRCGRCQHVVDAMDAGLGGDPPPPHPYLIKYRGERSTTLGGRSRAKALMAAI